MASRRLDSAWVPAQVNDDGRTDGDEVVVHGGKYDPESPDTDGDGLTDHQEVFQFQGRFNPNDPDTDDDGTSDFFEAFPQGDEDQDGLSNGDEAAKGTSPTRPDSDCDGVQDGPEANYWGAAGIRAATAS